MSETPELLTPSEVARMLRVDPKTVTRWAKTIRDGKPLLEAIRTPGGHRRFRRTDVEAYLERFMGGASGSGS